MVNFSYVLTKGRTKGNCQKLNFIIQIEKQYEIRAANKRAVLSIVTDQFLENRDRRAEEEGSAKSSLVALFGRNSKAPPAPPPHSAVMLQVVLLVRESAETSLMPIRPLIHSRRYGHGHGLHSRGAQHYQKLAQLSRAQFPEKQLSWLCLSDTWSTQLEGPVMLTTFEQVGQSYVYSLPSLGVSTKMEVLEVVLNLLLSLEDNEMRHDQFVGVGEERDTL